MAEPVRVAAVDIGTNTVRLLVADVTAGSVEWCHRVSRVVRLGEGVDASGRLDAAAAARTLDALAEYAGIVAGSHCGALRAVATSAVRDAANRDEFLDQAGEVLGTRPEMISGAEEADLSFTGTTAAATGSAPYLVIDPGGGSTEYVMGGDAPVYSVSVDIGSVRLTERAFARQPPSRRELAAARESVAQLLATEVHLPEPPATVLGVGGTYTSLGGIFLGDETYDATAVHGTELGRGDLAALVRRIAELPVAGIANLPSLDPKRAPVLLGGAVVAEQSLVASGSDVITVSESDILDGIAIGLAAG